MQPNTTISGRGATSRRTDSKPFANSPQLQLTFSQGPKVPQEGYSFGTNPHGDVLLGGKKRKHNIIHRHLCITFDHRGRLILRDSSRWGTAVSYGGPKKAEVRKHFTWILDLDKDSPDTTKEVVVYTDKLGFIIRIPDHADCQSKYDDNVKDLLMKDRANLLKLNGLGIDSIKKTLLSCGASSCDQKPIYINSGSLGSGSFGNVTKITDVSTGDIYARKTFKPPQRQVDATTWLKRIENEINIMMKNKHVSSFYTFDETSVDHFEGTYHATSESYIETGALVSNAVLFSRKSGPSAWRDFFQSQRNG